MIPKCNLTRSYLNFHKTEIYNRQKLSSIGNLEFRFRKFQFYKNGTIERERKNLSWT